MRATPTRTCHIAEGTMNLGRQPCWVRGGAPVNPGPVEWQTPPWLASLRRVLAIVPLGR